MLTLPINKKWFDMSVNGTKKEEYRDIKPYWTKRLSGLIGINESELFRDVKIAKDKHKTICYLTSTKPKVMYRNGYSIRSPYFIATVRLKIGYGKKEWGALDEICYILEYVEIIEVGNLEEKRNE